MKEMSNQPRVVKVLSALVVSMTTGVIVLMALGNNAPLAGPFSLSAYTRLDPIEKAINSIAPQSPERWNSIEIYYSGSKAGNIEQLASLEGLSNPEDINCHFCIYNGLGGENGRIEPTEKWHRQWSSTPSATWYGSGQTVRICLISDGKNGGPTNYQRRRLTDLVEALSHRFNIKPESVYYPGGWQ
jgi:hypothetical protein